MTGPLVNNPNNQTESASNVVYMWVGYALCEKGRKFILVELRREPLAIGGDLMRKI